MCDRVEVAFQICFRNPDVACLEQAINLAQRLPASPTRTQAVALGGKALLKDRLNAPTQRTLRDPISSSCLRQSVDRLVIDRDIGMMGAIFIKRDHISRVPYSICAVKSLSLPISGSGSVSG